MRILVVAEQYPWPAVDGYRRRLDHIVRGLTRVGEVHVVALHRAGTAEPSEPDIPGVAVTAVPVGPDRSVREWLPAWLRSRAPRRVLGPDWSAAHSVLEGLAGIRAPLFDVVWYSHVDSWFATHNHVHAAHSFIDFDNLENLHLRLRRKLGPRYAPGAGLGYKVRATARWAFSRMLDLVDEKRWENLQREAASTVDRVAVCSKLDVERSGCPNAVVIGNGADRQITARTDRRVNGSERPTMLFIGALDYEPNSEAIDWFAREIFPLITEQMPAARARIVGRGGEQLGWVNDVSGLELPGAVDSVESELSEADVSIVPISVGAGTRLKVVEALAHHVPMVTTRVGCEGIDLLDGQHALIVDDAEGFAAACVRLLNDPELRQTLADNGAELFTTVYDWDLIEAGLAEMIRNVVDNAVEQ